MSLGPMKTYYIRTRQRSKYGKVSPWTDVKQFKTKNEFWTETATINRPGQASANYGRSVTMSGDGMYFAATDSGKKRYSYIYRKEGMAWILDQTLAHPNYNMGYDTDYSYDASTFVVGGYGGGTRTAVYRKVNGVWSNAFILTADNYNDHGYSVSLSGNGNTVVAASPNRNVVRVYDWNGTNYTQTASLNYPGVSNIGTGCSISRDGLTIVAGSVASRCAVVFRKIDGTWQFFQLLNGGVKNFGISVDVSDDCKHIAVGCTDNRSVYVYKGCVENVPYVQEAVLTSVENPSEFGRSVAISENGCGLVVGAKGGVCVFRHDDVSWFEQQFLNPSITPNKDGNFGMNVAVDRRNTSAIISYHAERVFVFNI